MKNFTLRRHNQRGYGVYTKKPWKKGEKVLVCEGEILPTYMANVRHSITLNAHFSYEWKSNAAYDYVNHSCNPNCYIDLSNGMPALIALRDIPSEEEICYNYNTAALDLCKNWISFPCHCGNENCIGLIKGFMYLTPIQEKEVLSMCIPFIKEVRAKNRVET